MTNVIFSEYANAYCAYKCPYNAPKVIIICYLYVSKQLECLQ